MQSKKELRKEILTKRNALSFDEQSEKSKGIIERIMENKNFIEADKILLFASYKSEVDTTGLFRVARTFSKDVYYPKVVDEVMEFYLVENQSDLIEGYRGICEPNAERSKKFIPKLDDKVCVIMPGLAFDEEGNRIGYGGGYYDKFLGKLETEFPRENICKIAIAFDCQVIETGRIERESHDIRPDYIVTEERIISV